MRVRWVREQRLSVMPVSSPRPSTRGCESMGRYLGALVPSFSIRARNSSTVQHRMSRVPCVVCVCGRVRLVRACGHMCCVTFDISLLCSLGLLVLVLVLVEQVCGYHRLGRLGLCFLLRGRLLFLAAGPSVTPAQVRILYILSRRKCCTRSIKLAAHTAHTAHTPIRKKERECLECIRSASFGRCRGGGCSLPDRLRCRSSLSSYALSSGAVCVCAVWTERVSKRVRSRACVRVRSERESG